MKKIIIPIIIVLAVVLAIVLILAKNKAELNKARTPVDRTNVPVAINVSPAAYRPLEVNMQYPATIQPSEEATIYAQTNGMIASLNIFLGQQVRKGEVVGNLDSRTLAINLKQAEISLHAAVINRSKMLDDYNRARDLYENKAGLEVNMLTAKNNFENAQSSYDNAQNNIRLIRQQIANAKIVAPLSGTVSAQKVKQGEYVSPSTPIASIANINTLKTTVFVDQATTYRLKSGQTANIISPVFPDQIFLGKIIYISPVADPNHNYQVDLQVMDKDGISLKGGTDAQVSFNSIPNKEVLQIPKSALMTDAAKPYVYVVKDGKAEVKKVMIGVVKNDKVEILSGLTGGEQVVTAGQISLKEGSNIFIIKN